MTKRVQQFRSYNSRLDLPLRRSAISRSRDFWPAPLRFPLNPLHPVSRDGVEIGEGVSVQGPGRVDCERINTMHCSSGGSTLALGSTGPSKSWLAPPPETN